MAQAQSEKSTVILQIELPSDLAQSVHDRVRRGEFSSVSQLIERNLREEAAYPAFDPHAVSLVEQFHAGNAKMSPLDDAVERVKQRGRQLRAQR